jgi:hypothetical protein
MLWQGTGPGDGDRQPEDLPPLPVTRLQRTRLHNQFGLAIQRLQAWADNPWRRLSLQVIVLLTTFYFGGAIGMITGALAYIDPLAALFCVLLIELSVRTRRALLRRGGNRLALQLSDAARVGWTYGLMLEAFKLV